MVCAGILKCEKIEMLNYLHKSREWPKSITAFQYVVNTIRGAGLARASSCYDQTPLLSQNQIAQHTFLALSGAQGMLVLTYLHLSDSDHQTAL